MKGTKLPVLLLKLSKFPRQELMMLMQTAGLSKFSQPQLSLGTDFQTICEK